MIETFTALLFAHILADFALQPGWMVARKKDPGIILLHVFVVMGAAMLALGQLALPWVLALGAAHLAIDLVKVHLLPKTLGSFALDQVAHVASIAVITAYAPTLFADGCWPEWALSAMALVGGAILTIPAGGFVVGLLMKGLTPALEDDGLPSGGQTIGWLERGLIFVLVIAGQPGAIGFLIAAKSILRFSAVNENRAASEYVIIGTLASFGWALAVSFATVWLYNALGPLEIAASQP